ncbi:hypothetical protein TWF481_010482 [Arthrobotrys musiformis]|uniref:Uncharacterized protein n=1 Tax=Arthrobotrys musiformis TaxID=47236 RepID=A0AAV9W0X4_9PEZI
MKSRSIIVLGAILATANAIPVEGVEGGMVVQGGNADTHFGMFFKQIKNVLETAAGKEEGITETTDSTEDLGENDASEASESGTIVTEELPEPSVREEKIVIMETMPTSSELIMPGLLSMLSSQRISPPSPVEQALDAVEEVLEGLRHTGFADEAELNLIEIDFPDRAPSPPSGLPDLLSMLEPMIEPTFPIMGAGEAMMIEIV